MISRERKSRFAMLASVMALCGLAVLPVRAESKEFGGQVMIILAKEQPGEMDASLAGMAALRRPPFNAFTSMQVLSRPRVRLRLGKAPTEVTLPNGYRLQLVAEKVLPDGKVQVKATLRKPSENRDSLLLTVLATPGDPFFVAGQRHQGGTLIVGVILET